MKIPKNWKIPQTITRGAMLGIIRWAKPSFVIGFLSKVSIGSKADVATKRIEKNIITGKMLCAKEYTFGERKILASNAKPKTTRFVEMEKPVPPNSAIA